MMNQNFAIAAAADDELYKYSSAFYAKMRADGKKSL